MVETPPDPHACCKHKGDDPDQAPRPTEGQSPDPAGDPCGHCNLRHAAERVAPEGPAKAVSPFDGVPSAAADASWASQPARGPASLSRADDIPIPPLLRDLFHSHCLLTN